MAFRQAEFDAVIKMTLSKSGKREFSNEDIALAMLEVEQELNTIKLEPYSGANKYIRVHVGMQKAREGSNGDHQD